METLTLMYVRNTLRSIRNSFKPQYEIDTFIELQNLCHKMSCADELSGWLECMGTCDIDIALVELMYHCLHPEGRLLHDDFVACINMIDAMMFRHLESLGLPIDEEQNEDY